VAVVGVILVVAATIVAPKLGVAAPLLLTALGFGLSLLPFIDPVVVAPEWILAGVLPPLLYSMAVSTPVMDFRRDFRLISAFSVSLVVITSLAVALATLVLVPEIPFGLGIAFGAIISPTDAIASSIVRRAGVSPRLVTVLEGESMLNDASALVLLRTAVAAFGVTLSVWQVGVQFLWAVAAAVVLGWLVGKGNLLVRRWIRQVPAGVALSLVVPFAAYLPAEYLGASGLVAAVTAGLVTGYGAPRRMGAEERIAERAVWKTIELLLESAVFLLIGLELPTLVTNLSQDGAYLDHPLVLAVVAGAIVIVVRAAFVAFALWRLARRNRHTPRVREQLSQLHDQLEDGQRPAESLIDQGESAQIRRIARRRTKSSEPKEVSRWQRLLDRRIADLNYLAAEQFGWREGVVLVWAGLRGAVTIAAAQSLPVGTAHRPMLVLAATALAVGTLVIQGLTLKPLARRLGLAGSESDVDPELWQHLQTELDTAAQQELPAPEEGEHGELLSRVGERLKESAEGAGKNWFGLRDAESTAAWAAFRELRLAAIISQRDRLLDLRALGSYPSAMLDDALAQLDAQQISIELRQQYD
jgi:CPA1 family monovalent cation:H+ antiporter